MFRCDAGDRLFYESYEKEQQQGGCVNVSVGDIIIGPITVNVGPITVTHTQIITNTIYVQNEPQLKTVYRQIVK